jgi:hypothetical protein
MDVREDRIATGQSEKLKIDINKVMTVNNSVLLL